MKSGIYLFRFKMVVFGFGIFFEFNLNVIKFKKVKFLVGTIEYKKYQILFFLA
jgi:hypothetical protein